LARELTAHKIAGCNQLLSIAALGPPGPGGACRHYRVSGFCSAYGQPEGQGRLEMHFQHGLPSEVGVNGITDEVLLAVLIDRLEGFLQGPFACRESDAALTHLRNALAALQVRTRDRLARGVEGRHVL
jgi:hypothetical protein